jgi:hypothetical protein
MPGPISQEDFNRYMDAYVKRQKGQDFQQPSQGPRVLKRDRMEAGLDSQDNDRVTPACEAPTTNPSNQPGPREEQVDRIPSDRASLDRLISAQVDKAIQRTLAQDDTVLQPPKIPAATRPRMYASTKLMQKETKYDLESILRIMFAGRLCTGGRGEGDGGASAERDGRVQMVVEGCYGGNGQEKEENLYGVKHGGAGSFGGGGEGGEG